MDTPVFIPGWLDLAALHGYEWGVDIWKGERISPEGITGPVIAHSAGALYVLQHIKEIRSNRIILVNPPIPQRNLFDCLYRRLKCVYSEGTLPSWKRLALVVHIIPGLFLLFRLFRVDFSSVIDAIGPARLVFVRGEQDCFFFDGETAEELRAKGFEVVTVSGSGHSFDQTIKQVADELATRKSSG